MNLNDLMWVVPLIVTTTIVFILTIEIWVDR